jgi:excinuclease UvrABC ATPase subunit
MVELTRAMKDDAAAQEDVPEMLGVLLDKTIERNDRLGHVSELTEFESATCNLSASAYLKRIMNYSGCSECCAVVGLLYLQRLKQRVQTLRLTSNNLQRLLLTSVMVAAKFLDDMYYSNKHWAQIGGLSLKDVNSLEMIFLFRLNFDLQMTRETYEEYVAHLLLIS